MPSVKVWISPIDRNAPASADMKYARMVMISFPRAPRPPPSLSTNSQRLSSSSTHDPSASCAPPLPPSPALFFFPHPAARMTGSSRSSSVRRCACGAPPSCRHWRTGHDRRTYQAPLPPSPRLSSTLPHTFPTLYPQSPSHPRPTSSLPSPRPPLARHAAERKSRRSIAAACSLRGSPAIQAMSPSLSSACAAIRGD